MGSPGTEVLPFLDRERRLRQATGGLVEVAQIAAGLGAELKPCLPT